LNANRVIRHRRRTAIAIKENGKRE